MSDQPPIIRQDVQHSVSVAEGTGVATSKPSDPHAPQVRQNLVGHDHPSESAPSEGQPEIPPSFSAAQDSAGTVFERTAPGAAERMVQAPEDVPASLTASQGDTETAVDRFLRERRLAAAEAAAVSEQSSTGPVFERSVRDRLEPLPAAQSSPGDGSEGPVFERSMQDHFEPIPVQVGPHQSSEGPVVERSVHDHLEQTPVLPARYSQTSEAPVFERAIQDHTLALPSEPVRTAPREGSRSRAPDPVPIQEAQQLIAEAAQDLHQRVEENIGVADQDWVEMDFPARVVKLKIENDKVRVRLDQLEAMAGPSRRTNAPA